VTRQPGARGHRPLDEAVRAAWRQAEHVNRVAEEIERRRRDAERQGRSFGGPTAEQLLDKLRRERASPCSSPVSSRARSDAMEAARSSAGTGGA
jgi:hypothetical protein